MTTIATTDQKKARLLDLTTGILEMVRDGNRNYDEVIDVFQVIKEECNFATILGRKEPVVSKPVPPLLEKVGQVTIAATTEKFVAREKFVVNVVNTDREAKVKIAWLGNNFKDWFLGKTEAPATEVKIAWLGNNFKDWFLGKTEAPATEVNLDYARLTRPMLDDEIRKEIGAGREETTLAAIWALMERQPNANSGAFLANGYANIFYVRDVNGGFWAVSVYWDADVSGWDVHAFSVSNPSRWGVGCQVFSQVA